MSTRTINGMGVGVFQVGAGDPAVIARRAEELGFTSYWLGEHTVIPKGSDEIYPGKKPGAPTPDYLFKLPDPLIGLSRASGATTTIRLGTGIALLPERNPLLTAKQVASLDHFSGGRFVFGIGAGWNEPECTVLGGDFAHRWTQSKESVDVMKLLWSGEYVEHRGRYYAFPPVICLPRPAQRPHPPILLASIGSPKVFRRVAEWGDGWLPFAVDPQEIADGKAQIASYARAAHRDPDQFDITLFAPSGYFRKRADLREAASAAANNTVIWLQGNDEQDLLAEMAGLAAEFFS